MVAIGCVFTLDPFVKAGFHIIYQTQEGVFHQISKH